VFDAKAFTRTFFHFQNQIMKSAPMNIVFCDAYQDSDIVDLGIAMNLGKLQPFGAWQE